MTAQVLLSERQVMVAVRAMLLSILPSGLEVVKGQDNRVGIPKGADFAVVTVVGRDRQSTNLVRYDDNQTVHVRMSVQPTTIDFQVDVYGPNSAENVQIISTLAQDLYASIFFRDLGIAAAVLSSTDPRQMPWITGEQQFENRWQVDISVQANIAVSVPQTFADAVQITPLGVL